MDKIGGSIVTVDIGTTKVSLIITKINKFNKLEIVHIETKSCNAVENGEITEPYKIAEILKDSIAQIESRYGLKIKSSYANISNKYLTVEEITENIDIDEKLGLVQKYDIDKLFNKIKQLQVQSNEKIVDIVPLQYYDSNNNIIANLINCHTSKLRLRSQIFIAERSYVEKIESIFQYAGIKLDGLIPQALSDADLVLSEEEKKEGTLLIDVGGANTDLSLYINNGLIYIDNIPIGSDDITGDIAEKLYLSRQEADKLKKQYALALKNMIENDYMINVVDKDRKNIKINCSKVVEIIEKTCQLILENINQVLDEVDAKKYIKKIVFIGRGLNTINKIEVLAKNVLNKEIKLVNFKQTTMVKPVHTTVYAMQEYVLNNSKNINSRLSSVEEVNEKYKKGVISKLVDKFKDFLYT